MHLMLRACLACVICCGLAGIAWAADISYAFEKDTDGFTVLSGKATLTQETAAPLAGAGSLRVTLDAAATDVRIISPAITVKPWTVYRLTDKRTVPAGMDVRATAQFADGAAWRDVTLTVDEDGWAFGTLPATQRARIVYNIHVEKTDKTALLDAITLTVKSEMVKERGKNLFTDPSLEAATTAPPTGWDTWVNAPQKSEISTQGGHTGKQYYRVTGNTVYVILPLVQVQANRLYRIRFWVRGEGQIYFGLHKLAPNTPANPDPANVKRIGWAPATVDGVLLKPDTWQQVEMLVVAENAAVRWLNPYFNMKGSCTVEIDDLEAISLDEAAVKAP